MFDFLLVMDTGQTLIPFILTLIYSSTASTEDITISSETNATDIFCYACGLREMDPELDQVGSFGDARR